MVKKTILIIPMLIALLQPTTYAQPAVDSLKSLLNKSNKQEKVSLLNSLSSQLRGSSPDESIKYAEDALRLARELNLKEQEAAALRNIGVAYSILSKYQEALKYFEESLTVAEMHGPKQSEASSLNAIGGFHYLTGNNYKALEYFNKAVNIAQELDDKAGLVNYLNNIGLILGNLGEYNQSLQYYLQSLSLSEELNDKRGVMRASLNIGTIYNDLANHNKALEFYQNAFKIAESLKDKHSMAVLHNNMGSSLRQKGQISDALQQHKKALSMTEELGDQFGIAFSLSNIGTCLKDLNRYDEAISYQIRALEINREIQSKEGIAFTLLQLGLIEKDRGRNAAAISYLDEGLKEAKDLNLKLRSDFYSALAKSYKAINNLPLAYEFLNLHIAAKDSLHSQANIAQVNEFQAKYDYEKQRAEIELLRKDAEIQELAASNQKVTRNMLIVGILSLIVIAGVLYKANTSKQKINKLLEEQNKKIIEQNKQLAELITTKDRFLSILSHDLRSPFQPLLGLSEIMYIDTGSLSRKELSDYSKEIHHLLKNQYDLLQKLLEWSRLQGGIVKVSPVQTNIKDRVENTIFLLRVNARNKNISLLNEVEPDTIILTDQNMLDSILQNLISNAVKFSPPESAVRITSRLNDGFINVSVIDPGTGIPEDKLDVLFRTDISYATKGTAGEKGSGLGLILCKELSEKLGGTISVKSKIAEGSEFIVSLPLK